MTSAGSSSGTGRVAGAIQRLLARIPPTLAAASTKYLGLTSCMKANTVVGPTNFQPRRFRSFDSAMEAGDTDAVWGVPHASGAGSKRQK